MNEMRRKCFSGLLLITLGAFALWAGQDPQAGHTPPTPDQMASHMVSRLGTILSLTSDQQAQATTIFTAEAAGASALRTEMQTARKALRTAIQGNDGAAISAAAVQIGTLTTQQTEAEAKAQAAFYAILTSDQKAKYEQMHAPGPGGFGGPGGPGGPRGPGGPPPGQ